MTQTDARFVPIQTLFTSKTEWAVYDTKTRRLVERAGITEKYPATWAHQRARQLNLKDKEK